MDPEGPKHMQKKQIVPTDNSKEPTFDFDLEAVKASIESGVITFPRGLKAQERKEWVRNQLKALDSHHSS
ncbi:hypothetical protein PPUJ13061_49200 [Pseudomonas putida]|nr:hypothetical protein PPUJ13061_49200 [Pseudomonas putida]